MIEKGKAGPQALLEFFESSWVSLRAFFAKLSCSIESSSSEEAVTIWTFEKDFLEVMANEEN